MSESIEDQVRVRLLLPPQHYRIRRDYQADFVIEGWLIDEYIIKGDHCARLFKTVDGKLVIAHNWIHLRIGKKPSKDISVVSSDERGFNFSASVIPHPDIVNYMKDKPAACELAYRHGLWECFEKV